MPTILFGAGLWLAGTVYAAPEPDFPHDGSVTDVAIRGANSGITAPESDFEITTDASYNGTVTVTLVGACITRTAGSPGLSATIDGQTKNTNSNCSGNNLVFNNVNFGSIGPSSVYDNQLKTRNLKVVKINGQGHQPFTVNVQGPASSDATVSFAGDPNRFNGSFSGFSGDAFALFPADPAVFAFTPDCNYNGQPVHLKWQDADVGSTFQDANIDMYLQEYDAQNNFVQTLYHPTPDKLGINGQRVSSPAIPLKAGYKYKWVWRNVAGVNALQVLVPFSENSYDVNLKCDKPPTGSITGNCTTLTGSAIDPDSPGTDLQVSIYYQGARLGGRVQTDSSHNFSKDVSSVTSGGGTFTFDLYAIGVDTSGNENNRNPLVDSVTVNCGGVGGFPTCTGEDYNIQEHSNYRFTVFNRDGDYKPSGTNPGNNPVPVSGPNAGGVYSSGGPTYNNGNPPPAPVDTWINFNPDGHIAQQGFNNSTANPKAVTINFPPPSGPDIVVYVENWHHDPATGKWQYSYKIQKNLNCYSATCSVSIVGNLPPSGSNHVMAATNYGAVLAVNNTGKQPLQSIGWGGNANANPNPSQGIAVGSGGQPSITMSPAPLAPGAIGTYTLTASVYYGSYAVANCGPATIDVYQHFTLVPGAGIAPGTSTENPKTINYNTSVTQGPDPYAPYQYTGTIPSNTHSILNYRPYGTPPPGNPVQSIPRSGNYGNASYLNTYINPNPINAGDQYCPVMLIDTATGWIGPGGAIVDSASDPSSSGCLTVGNRPYFKVYGGGIAAGGAYKALAGSCTGGGTLGGWNNNTGTNPASGDFGASAQLNAVGLTHITGFASAQTAFGRPPTDLSFANSGVITTSDTYSPSLGGSFGGPHCLTPLVPPIGGAQPLPSTDVGALASGAYTIGNGSSQVTLTASGQIAPGKNVSIFVLGDVQISSDIIYAGSGGGWTLAGANSVPSFTLVATGNIYIQPNVGELDGLYSSEPVNLSSGGKIYTCGSGFAAMPATGLFGCRKQLTVYGSFVANQIDLERAIGSLRDETPVGAGPPPVLTCSNNGGKTSPRPTCSAEVFDFSPDFYLSTPAIGPPSGGAQQWDAITSLPPVL